jgi:amino acid adenylation domain-containing protein
MTLKTGPMATHNTFRASPELIAAQAKLDPDRLAISSDSGELTYRELEARANRLAYRLFPSLTGPEPLVGICLDRSPEFIIAALAVLKCGAAYLPMDAGDPSERLRFTVQDAGVQCVITNNKLAGHFVGLEVKVVRLDAEQKEIEKQSLAPIKIDIGPENLAYVIYTSGSTGQPKGVEIAHRNLSNLIAWHLRAFKVNQSTRATFQAGTAFDAAVWEIWPHLAAGATIYIPNESTRMSAHSLRDWLVANRITISFVSTAIAEQLLDLTWPKETALRFLLTGADTLHRYPPPGLPFAFVNNYGPTECAVVATSGTIAPREDSAPLPSIGSPIDNVHIHILNEQFQPVPKDAVGEIFIGGMGVGRGYRNHPDLTAIRFIADPFCSGGGLLFRTGDLGRFLPNGEIAFLGRVDDQVKMRGYRVELGEISAVLNCDPSVQTSVVAAREDNSGEKRLVAYLVPKAGSKPTEQSLREAIRQRLPDYMEPSAFIWLETLPLTPNGKIDRAALPLPNVQTGATDVEFVAPRNPTEEALAEIISDVLKVQRVSVHDDFFHLGAHSLLGAQIVAHVRNVFGAELKLLDVFDAPTVAQLSGRIEQALAREINAMNEAEVDAAIAALNENARR